MRITNNALSRTKLAVRQPQYRIMDMVLQNKSVIGVQWVEWTHMLFYPLRFKTAASSAVSLVSDIALKPAASTASQLQVSICSLSCKSASAD